MYLEFMYTLPQRFVTDMSAWIEMASKFTYWCIVNTAWPWLSIQGGQILFLFCIKYEIDY